MRKIGGGLTARKSPIGSTNHQWGMKKTPTDGSFTLYKYTKTVNNSQSIIIIIGYET